MLAHCEKSCLTGPLEYKCSWIINVADSIAGFALSFIMKGLFSKETVVQCARTLVFN